MYIFLERLRQHGVAVSVREWLDFHAVLKGFAVPGDLTTLHRLGRLTLAKDERLYDRFDRAFADFIDAVTPEPDDEEPPGELVGAGESREVNELAGQRDVDREPDQDNARSEDTTSTHSEPDDGDAAGSGDGDEPGEGSEGEGGEGEGGEDGESGESGEAGEEGEDGEEGEGPDGLRGKGWSETGESGVRDRETEEPRQRAEAVWLERRFEDYDDTVELGTRTFRMALRRLRHFAREAADLELDLPGTISSTARQGWLDIRMVPERRNAIRVLLLLDVGGSMDTWVEETRQLFVAASSEFRHLETFYFHNCVYNALWRSNERGSEERTSLVDVFRRFGANYKVVIVGDANMSPRELTETGGSVERYNPEPGEVYLTRLTNHFRRVVWLNPEPARYWPDIPTCVGVSDLLGGEMYPLSADGITGAMRSLLR